MGLKQQMSFLEIVVLPVVALLIGYLSLENESTGKSSDRPKRLALLISLLLTCGLSIFFGFVNERESLSTLKEARNERKGLLTKNESIEKLSLRIDALLGKVSGTVNTTQETVDQIAKKLSDRGANVNPLNLAASNEADIRHNEILVNQSVQNSNQGVTIQYFVKSINYNLEIIKTELEKAGFNLVEPRSNLLDIPTNAI